MAKEIELIAESTQKAFQERVNSLLSTGWLIEGNMSVTKIDIEYDPDLHDPITCGGKFFGCLYSVLMSYEEE